MSSASSDATASFPTIPRISATISSRPESVMPTAADRRLEEIVAEMRGIVGNDAVASDDAELMVYECDAMTTHKSRPLAVVFPRTTDHVSRLVRLLSANGIAFGPRGAGTGLS